MSAEAELEKTDIYSVISTVLWYGDVEFIDYIIGNGTVFPTTVYHIIRLWDRVTDWFCELPDSDSIEDVMARLRREHEETGHLPPDFIKLIKNLNPGKASILLVIARRKEDEYTIAFYEELLKVTKESMDKMLEYLQSRIAEEEAAS